MVDALVLIEFPYETNTCFPFLPLLTCKRQGREWDSQWELRVAGIEGRGSNILATQDADVTQMHLRDGATTAFHSSSVPSIASPVMPWAASLLQDTIPALLLSDV